MISFAISNTLSVQSNHNFQSSIFNFQFPRLGSTSLDANIRLTIYDWVFSNDKNNLGRFKVTAPLPCGLIHRSFVKIIHRKKHSQKSAFWKRGTAVLTSCLSGSFEIDIESKWVYSHIKLSFSISYMMIKVRTQFDMVVNPL